MRLKTLQDAMQHFSDPQTCIDYIVSMRWPEGVTCPSCHSKDVTYLPARRLYQCKSKHPKKQFSVKVGTIMEDSPIALGKWLLISWMLVNCRNGISSYEVARTIGITQKSAWFMLHRLREAMTPESIVLGGRNVRVEADECYLGPNPKKMRPHKRRMKSHIPIFGVVERGGSVVAHPMPQVSQKAVEATLGKHVAMESIVHTDGSILYEEVHKMPHDYWHRVIDHSRDRFAVGTISTNAIENFWSQLKRVLKGTYIRVSPDHLAAYVNEQAFRHNVRKKKLFSEEGRFVALLDGIPAKRLTWDELTGRLRA